MWQTGGKAFYGSSFSVFPHQHGNGSDEQISYRAKTSKNCTKVFCFALCHQNAHVVKWPSFEPQAANLQSFQAKNFSADLQRVFMRCCSVNARHIEAAAITRGWSSSHSVAGRHPNKFRLDVGAILALHMTHSDDGDIIAEQKVDDIDTGLKSPSLRRPTVPAGTMTSLEVPLDTGKHEIRQVCNNVAQKPPPFHEIESHQVRNVVVVASGNTNASNDCESSVEYVDIESRMHSIDGNPSSQTQALNGEVPMVTGGRDGNNSVRENQDTFVKCGDDCDYAAMTSLVEGLNDEGEKDSLPRTTGAHTASEKEFEGFQPTEVGNDSIGGEHNSASERQASEVTIVCEDGQICGHVDDVCADFPETYRQGSLMECCVESQDPAEPSESNIIKAMGTVESPSNVMALRMPIYRPRAHHQEPPVESERYLEDLGIDCAKIFESEPRLKLCTIRQIKAMVSTLEGYGLNSKDAGRVFVLCPKVLLLNQEKDINLVTEFLFYEAGVSQKDFRKVMRRCPKLLIMDVNTHLRPTLKFLRTLGYMNIGHCIAKTPSLLSYDVNSRILPRLRLLESWGFTYREAAAMAVRFPALFNYCAVNNLQCKYDYLVKEIGATKKDLLAFPQYFGHSLEHRIRPRHLCAVKLNISLSLQSMLTPSNAEFRARFLRGKQALWHHFIKDLSKSAISENSDTPFVVSK